MVHLLLCSSDLICRGGWVIAEYLLNMHQMQMACQQLMHVMQIFLAVCTNHGVQGGMTDKKLKTFAQRRDQWMRNLLKSDLPAGAKVVGMRLALYMHEKKTNAHPSYDALGEVCGMSARQAQTSCLLLAGHLPDHKKSGQRWLTMSRKRNAGNTYWLNYWWE